jgi:Ser/Thr protein kinase RdoA (MazF antagonist)
LEPVPSKSGEKLVQKMTPWGEQYASVFKQVKGEPLEESSYADEIMFAYGAALGQLHTLSRAYDAPQTKRWTHLEVFDWIEVTLIDLANQPLALEELRLLRGAFAALPASPDSYGLIHYDFELDNVYYEAATGTCSVIDFDDAMYHWYLLDVLNALVSLKKEIPREEDIHKKAAFLGGYRSKFDLDDDHWAIAPLLLRFDNLYSYTRNARAVQETWEHEPAWMVELRAKLARAQAKESVNFGRPISISLYNDVW